MKPKFKLRADGLKWWYWLPRFYSTKLRWKDKYSTPRVESCPHFMFTWLCFEIYGVWGDDGWWERWLWIHKYNDGDYDKAEETWPWVDVETGISSWRRYNIKLIYRNHKE